MKKVVKGSGLSINFGEINNFVNGRGNCNYLGQGSKDILSKGPIITQYYSGPEAVLLNKALEFYKICKAKDEAWKINANANMITPPGAPMQAQYPSSVYGGKKKDDKKDGGKKKDVKKDGGKKKDASKKK